MAKLLNTTLLVTMSKAIPEGLGYGNIYASASKIYFTSSLGVFDLTDSKGYIIVREYVASTTWSPPANVKYVRLLAVGGGGGGGGGAKRTAALGLNIGGGGGAAGGVMTSYMYTGDAFTRPIYQVTIGGGGNSGSGQTGAAGGNGTSGTTGGTTGLTSGSTVTTAPVVMIRAQGGALGGLGTTTNAGQGGAPSTGVSVPGYMPYVRIPLSGGNGFGISATFNRAANTIPGNNHALNGLYMMGSGGGGGGFQSGNTAVGTGSGVFVNNQILSASNGGLPGTGQPGTNGVADLLDIMNLFFFSGSNTVTSSYGVGSAGGGGANGDLIGTIGGGNGGNGATIGAGGGGGGSCNTGSATAGNGGKGGDGYLAIIEYY